MFLQQSADSSDSLTLDWFEGPVARGGGRRAGTGQLPETHQVISEPVASVPRLACRGRRRRRRSARHSGSGRGQRQRQVGFEALQCSVGICPRVRMR